MKTFLATLLLLAALAPVQAKAPKIIPADMVPTADATLSGLNSVMAESQKRQAQLIDRAAGLQKQVAALKAKVKNPKIDVAEQLSKEDFDAYNLYNVQLRYLENAELVEAVRQKDLGIARSIYQASYFVATMMTEYISSKGALDDDFDAFCRAKAKPYGLDVPVGLLLSAQDYIIDNTAARKK